MKLDGKLRLLKPFTERAELALAVPSVPFCLGVAAVFFQSGRYAAGAPFAALGTAIAVLAPMTAKRIADEEDQMKKQWDVTRSSQNKPKEP